jgi:hypothetical protein
MTSYLIVWYGGSEPIPRITAHDNVVDAYNEMDMFVQVLTHRETVELRIVQPNGETVVLESESR